MIVTEALRAPMAVGVNVTVIVQLFFAANDGVQVFVSAKSLELVPVIAILVKLIVFPAAALVSVMTCDVLVVPTVCEANVRLVGDREAIVPTPVKATVCDPPGTLSTTVSVAGRLLMPLGVKVTLMVQLAPPESADPQLLVCA